MSATASASAMAACSAVISISLLAIALLLGCAVLRIVCRGAARSLSSHAAADDPYFYSIGDAPSLPPDWQRERAISNYRRHLDADDFRAWGIPGPFCDRPTPASAGALQRNGDGGRPNHASRSGTAVVLSFPQGRRA